MALNLADLVRALLACDPLEARQWVADAKRLDFVWSDLRMPEGLDSTGLAVAAAVTEMLAGRAGQAPPPWTATVPPAPAPVFLVRAASAMPRLRRLCVDEGPEPLRCRNIFAPPEFLSVA
jgi:hypothetical protein